MCDTVVALGDATADGVTLLGKNSDREPNEAHQLLRLPAATHPPGSTVECTYIEIPQTRHTYEVLLARPFWIWGAEMGANAHGVAIANEAVFTKVPYEKDPALTGMDLLRLALERSRTSRQALDVITSLLTTHGQGGNCGFERQFYYHNSFVIADPHTAWVLETAGPHWVAERVDGFRVLSNRLTIGQHWDLASEGVIDYAVSRGWCQGRNDFNFADCYSDFLYTTFSNSASRQRRITALLQARKGTLTVASIMQVLRDHGSEAGPNWGPSQGLSGATVCMHAGFGPLRAHQTTGSMVSHLAPEVQTHYVTGTAAPCTSVFKPVWLGVPLPDTGPVPTSSYDEATLFWRHEALHRATLRDYATRIQLYRQERDTLERRFLACAQSRRDRPLDERAAYAARCFAQADEAEANWTERVLAHAPTNRLGPLYALAWRNFNHSASD